MGIDSSFFTADSILHDMPTCIVRKFDKAAKSLENAQAKTRSICKDFSYIGVESHCGSITIPYNL